MGTIYYPNVLLALTQENIEGLPPGGGIESKWVFNNLTFKYVFVNILLF